ncbi:hypothetical protein WDW37_06090 [Bdellovibrionota bacterium FG-1]
MPSVKPNAENAELLPSSFLFLGMIQDYSLFGAPGSAPLELIVQNGNLVPAGLEKVIGSSFPDTSAPYCKVRFARENGPPSGEMKIYSSSVSTAKAKRNTQVMYRVAQSRDGILEALPVAGQKGDNSPRIMGFSCYKPKALSNGKKFSLSEIKSVFKNTGSMELSNPMALNFIGSWQRAIAQARMENTCPTCEDHHGHRAGAVFKFHLIRS